MEIKRYIKAVLGGIIFGIIGSLPWLILFTFGPISIPLLAYLIAPSVNKGYRLFKGRVNRKFPYIIVSISTIVLVLIYFIYFPLIGGGLNNIFSLNYWQIMLRESLISLVATIVGIYKTYEDIMYEIGLRY